MPTLLPLLPAAFLLCNSAALQPETPTAPPPATLDSVAAGQRALIRARAMHCYKMPDGEIWDGSAYFEQRKAVDYSIKPFERVEPGTPVPGQMILEDHAVGTIWKVRPTREARAWGLISYLAGGIDDGQIPKGRFEASDRQRWLEPPPLWSCVKSADYSWPFAYVDESEPDAYTRLTHGGYLEVTREWGDGRYDFRGYSLDRGTLDGVVQVPEPARFIKKDRFKGTFFLWPLADAPAAASSHRAWLLIPADDLRTTPDELADALLTGKAQLFDWRFEIIKDKVVWKRTIHPVERAAGRPIPNPVAKAPKPVLPPAGGPDLIVLNDGRWFRGKITRHDDQAVTIRAFVGQSEMDMTFKPEEVKEIQAPEKR